MIVFSMEFVDMVIAQEPDEEEIREESGRKDEREGAVGGERHDMMGTNRGFGTGQQVEIAFLTLNGKNTFLPS